MKKTYKKPLTEVVETELTTLICASLTQSTMNVEDFVEEEGFADAD